MNEFYAGILWDYISAYRKLHSCETSLLRLTEEWRAMRDRGDLVAIVFMDTSKEFDVIQHPLFSLSKLEVYERCKLRFTRELSFRQISESKPR